MVLSIVALLMGSCTAMMNSSLYGSSDLYRSDNRIQVANELKAKAEAEKAEAEARKAMWEARIAEANASNAEAQYYASTTPSYSSIVADDYESAYARRLYGFSSPSYKLPSSYYSYSAYDAMRYATAYDPAYYNIMISGNQVWVEPRYITSMFGSWGATNVTFGIYSSPWNFGWSVHVDPFYYTWWGYPRYSWYDWNWNICYNPYHYWVIIQATIQVTTQVITQDTIQVITVLHSHHDLQSLITDQTIVQEVAMVVATEVRTDLMRIVVTRHLATPRQQQTRTMAAAYVAPRPQQVAGHRAAQPLRV